MNNKNITITGDLGSGKSYLSGFLIKELNCEYISTGHIQRKIAEKYNMTTLELNKYAETNKKIDEEVDNVLIELNNSPETHIVDSRLAWFFIPDSFKIYLRVNVEVAANRIYNDNRGAEKYASLEQTVNDILSRKKSENLRFLKYYNADCANMNNFNIVIDTTHIQIEKLCALIIQLRDKYIKGQKINHYWLSPKNLLPTKEITADDDCTNQLKSAVAGNGFDENTPVEVALFEDKYYIVDGHKRTSAAIFNGLGVIPVKVVVSEETPFASGVSLKDFVKKNCKKSVLTSWENHHDFKLSSL